MEPQQFYSHGKLLLSGEYLVLDGYWALGLPTRMGQTLLVESAPGPAVPARMLWESRDAEGKVWFQGTFSLPELRLEDCTDEGVGQRLWQLLRQCRRLKTDFLQSSGNIRVSSRLEFPREWGLGSSSTLIHNLSLWAGVDPYQLLWNTFGGSGYDIACAGHSRPILYRVKDEHPEIQEGTFFPDFHEQLFFVYLNRKQDSRQGIQQYRENQPLDPAIGKKISEISQELFQGAREADFVRLITEHERLVSRALGGIPSVQKESFSDFKGAIKSLGAWGGDFVLAYGESKYTPSYFADKGYRTVLPYERIILNGG